MQQVKPGTQISPLRTIHFRASTPQVRVILLSDDPGQIEFSGLPRTVVSIHVGPTALVTCRRGGVTYSGNAVHGDIDIIPAGISGYWELKQRDTALAVSLEHALLVKAVEELDADPRRLEIRNKFQIRDARMEHIGWALKEEIESGFSGGRLYLDSLATALAAQLVSHHSSLESNGHSQGGMPNRKLKQVLSYIEDNLGDDLSLHSIAHVAGLSISHCKVLFRKTMGMPIHQYVIRRRVDRAAELLRKGGLPVSEVAAETGFSHQSHLAAHMKRLLGIAPKVLLR
jgi:AraC family transcriptional regulator